MELIEQKIQIIKGIGPKKASYLKKIGVDTIEDILLLPPRDYEYFGGIKQINDNAKTEKKLLKGNFIRKLGTTRPRKGLAVSKLIFSDGTGEVTCIWYNQPYRVNYYDKSKTYCIWGKIIYRYGEIQIENPRVEEYNPKLHDRERILPLYPLTNGITQRDMRKYVADALRTARGNINDQMPLRLRKKLQLLDKEQAILNIHFPASQDLLIKARRRLVFEEFLSLQLALKAIYNKNKKKYTGYIFEYDENKINTFISNLDFKLTNAQNEVLVEIKNDLKSGRIMNRLVQGDVGSGKTIIACIALYCTFLNNYQGAMMVPTEILAKQHYESFKKFFLGYDIKIECILGSMKKYEKESIKQRLALGEIDIIIGTHALIQKDVEFFNLGMIVTDEQHRFGVRQRAMLNEKGSKPHMLVMSATPIPRTLALILYGDLDISVINELPLGRKAIKTYHVMEKMRKRVYDFIRKQAYEGRQSYIVCPLVEESENIDSLSATDLFENLKNGQLSDVRIALLHGKMKPIDKEMIMESFQKGDIDVLISTTVIEVGVNVPNATIMVIENAERFGLAQLHQLRGRVGRGVYQSYCILITKSENKIVNERMNIMVNSSDGFEIAEKDLKIRGPGDFLGVRQHGVPEFRIGDIGKDMELLKESQSIAKRILELQNETEFKDYIKYIIDKFERNIKNITMN